MIHYNEAITNTKGDALIGYFVRLADTSDDSGITLSADSNSTPIVSVSGLADAAKVDTDGMVSFWVDPGTYHLDVYATDGSTLVRRETFIQFGVPDADYGDVTVAGPAWTVDAVSGTAPTTVGLAVLGAASQAAAQTAIGAFPALNIKAFGAIGDDVADDTAAIQAAINAVNVRGGGELKVPEGRFKVGLLTSCANLTLRGEGAASVITSDRTTLTPTLAVTTANVTIENIQFELTSGDQNPWHIEVAAPDCKLRDVQLTKANNTGGYQMYVRYGADGFDMRGGGLNGSNGVFVEASRVNFDGVACFARTDGGGDDCIVFKAIQGVTELGRVANCYFEGYSAFVSFGSEIGVAAANDATHAKIARGFEIVGNVGKNCARMLYIKPGGVDAVDYRDGTVRGVNFSNNTLIDANGSALAQAVFISPGRGSRVYDVTGKGNLVIGRTMTGVAAPYGVYVLLRNDGVGTADVVVDRVELGIDVIDPFDGVAAGGAAPGSPFVSALVVEKQNSAHGTLSNATFDLKANGTLNNGVVVAAGLDDGVFLRTARLTNINASGSGANGGINVSSRVRVGPDVTISMIGGNPYLLTATGDIRCPELEREAFLHAQINAGNAEIQYPFVARRRVALIEMGLNCSSQFYTQDDANYRSLEFRRNGTLFHIATTKATGGTGESPTFGITPGVISTVFQLRAKTDAGNIAQCFWNEGDVMRWDANDIGAGRTLVAPRLGIRVAPY